MKEAVTPNCSRRRCCRSGARYCKVVMRSRTQHRCRQRRTHLRVNRVTACSEMSTGWLNQLVGVGSGCVTVRPSRIKIFVNYDGSDRVENYRNAFCVSWKICAPIVMQFSKLDRVNAPLQCPPHSVLFLRLRAYFLCLPCLQDFIFLKINLTTLKFEFEN